MRRHWLPERWSVEIDRLTHSRLAHRIFWIGIFFKAIDGLLETTGGVVLRTISNQTIAHITYRLVAPELAEDPNDWLANHLLTWMLHLSTDTRTFAMAYLLVHGIVKLVIVSTIWFGQLWAYWLAGVVFSLFVIYQMARFVATYSMMMLLLTAVDLVIIVLLPPEHRRLSLEMRNQDKKQR